MCLDFSHERQMHRDRRTTLGQTITKQLPQQLAPMGTPGTASRTRRLLAKDDNLQGWHQQGDYADPQVPVMAIQHTLQAQALKKPLAATFP
jgi:hypothetical protein